MVISVGGSVGNGSPICNFIKDCGDAATNNNVIHRKPIEITVIAVHSLLLNFICLNFNSNNVVDPSEDIQEMDRSI